MFLGSGLFAQTPQYLVKASFFERFARFVTWPENEYNSKEQFEIYIVGENFFEDYLETLYGNRLINNKPVTVHYVSKVSEIKQAHIVFISYSERYTIRKVLSELADKPFLLIGDTDGYAKKGVHINFYLTEKGTVHFELNKNAIDRANLNVSLLLIDFAKIVK